MLQYKKNDISEGIHTNNTNLSKDACFVTFGILKTLDSNFNHMLAINVMF